MQTYIKFLEKASSREKKFSPSCLRSQFQTLCQVRPGHGEIRRGHIEKQLEQLLQQVTTLRGGYCLSTIRGHIEKQLENFYNKLLSFAGTSPLRGPFKPRVACYETTIYNASPWTHFLLIVLATCSCEALYHVGLSLLLVIKVVFVVFPNSAGRIGNNSLSSLTVSDLLSVRYGRRQQRDRR